MEPKDLSYEQALILHGADQTQNSKWLNQLFLKKSYLQHHIFSTSCFLQKQMQDVLTIWISEPTSQSYIPNMNLRAVLEDFTYWYFSGKTQKAQCSPCSPLILSHSSHSYCLNQDYTSKWPRTTGPLATFYRGHMLCHAYLPPALHWFLCAVPHCHHRHSSLLHHVAGDLCHTVQGPQVSPLHGIPWP